MIRPATPLSILLLAAFGLLLISVLSVPIITSIPLGSFHGVTYGVFGLCTDAGCSGIEIGYDAGRLHVTSRLSERPCAAIGLSLRCPNQLCASAYADRV